MGSIYTVRWQYVIEGSITKVHSKSARMIQKQDAKLSLG